MLIFNLLIGLKLNLDKKFKVPSIPCKIKLPGFIFCNKQFSKLKCIKCKQKDF